MEWKNKEEKHDIKFGDTRVRTFFAWLPIKLWEDKITVWLKQVTVLEIFTLNSDEDPYKDAKKAERLWNEKTRYNLIILTSIGARWRPLKILTSEESKGFRNDNQKRRSLG